MSWEALLTWYDDKPWVCERIEKLEKDLKMCGMLSPTGALHYIRNIIGYEEYLKEYADYKGRKPEDLLGILDELRELAAGFKSLEEWEARITAIRAELLAGQRTGTEHRRSIPVHHAQQQRPGIPYCLSH